jgi:hypothetical protein
MDNIPPKALEEAEELLRQKTRFQRMGYLLAQVEPDDPEVRKALAFKDKEAEEAAKANVGATYVVVKQRLIVAELLCSSWKRMPD